MIHPLYEGLELYIMNHMRTFIHSELKRLLFQIMINDKTLITMDGRNVVFSVVQDRYVGLRTCPFFINNHQVITSISTENLT